MKNEIFLDFTIADFEDISHEEITQALGIKPMKIYTKGQKANPNFGLISRRNRWIIGNGLDKYASFEEHMNALLDIIESKKTLFKPFCEKYYCEFSCAIYVYYDNGESTPSIHFNSRYNKLIRELNIEFDLDLYCFSNEVE